MTKYILGIFAGIVAVCNFTASAVVFNYVTYQPLWEPDGDACIFVAESNRNNIRSANVMGTLTISGKEYTVTTINDYGFMLCRGLQQLQLPQTITNIGKEAFSCCRELKSINIPSQVARIEAETFLGCNALEGLEIPPSVKFIDYMAFAFCESLTNMVIPSTTEYIASSAFIGCFNLTDLMVEEDNPFYCSENGMLMSKDKETLLAFPGARYATLPNSIKVIELEAFGYSKLRSITIPEYVETIATSAFLSCTDLSSIRCLSMTPPRIAGNPAGFLLTDGMEKLNCTVYVPADAYDLYKAADGWGQVKLVADKSLGVEETTMPIQPTLLNVYTLDGTHVMTTTEREQIQRLPKGIYIVRSGNKSEKIIL
ncbi:MAG: leucine-rich repeat domain-containing protein [Muribaculaceae bacterium]|nr:leucine-rich repeat domain-containing protein [Muribaculaceae bacterium]